MVISDILNRLNIRLIEVFISKKPYTVLLTVNLLTTYLQLKSYSATLSERAVIYVDTWQVIRTNLQL